MLLLLLSCLEAAVSTNWTDDYVAFHEATRGRSNATYLIYHCEGTCGGLADRLKGILLAYYVAISSRRVFIVHMPQPVAFETLMLPHRIDWRWPGPRPLFCNVSSFDIDRTPRWLNAIAVSPDPWPSQPTVCIRLNVYGRVVGPTLAACRACSQVGHAPAGAFMGEAFRTLFTPAPSVWLRLRRLFSENLLPEPRCFLCPPEPADESFWIAAHIRTGDRNFHAVLAKQSFDAPQVATLARCVASMSVSNSTLVYIASDSIAAKISMRSLFLNATYSDFPVTHLDQQHDGAHAWTWAEFLTMAHAPCVLAARYSGYSLAASWLTMRIDDTRPRCYVMQPPPNRSCVRGERFEF